MQKQISRRDLLKLSMAGAGAIALGAVNAQASAVDAKDVKFDEEWDVIIIGSGFAGLAAGLKAAQKGSKYTYISNIKPTPQNSGVGEYPYRYSTYKQ